MAIRLGRERDDAEAVSRESEEAPAGQQLPAISAKAHAVLFGGTALWSNIEGAVGWDDSERAAVVGVVEPVGSNGGVAREGGLSDSGAVPCADFQPAVMPSRGISWPRAHGVWRGRVFFPSLSGHDFLRRDGVRHDDTKSREKWRRKILI